MNAAIEKAVKENQPFFAYMSHYAVHAPFLYPDQRFTQNYPQLNGHALAFATLIEGMDKSLGDMMERLDELGVAEDTLVIFYSDNGSANPLGSKPLRGVKGTRFEGGTRVPLIVAWAKSNPENPFQKRLPIEPGSRDDTLVTCTDFMPTLLKIGGAAHPAPETLDGFDLTPSLVGQEGQRPREFLVHFPHAHRNNLFSTLILGDWKVIYNYGPTSWELYHLKEDPFEMKNLAAENPKLLKEMAEALVNRLDANEASYPVSTQTGQPVKPTW
jgi:arylsulfatase A-like enzyme